MNKLYSVQILRGLAATGVVLFHLMLIEGKYMGECRLLPDFVRFGQSGVDLFFVISGFIITQMTYRSWTTTSARQFLVKRFARIYPTYWLYFFATFAVYLIKPTWVNNSQGNHFDFFSSILLVPSQTLPLVMVAWSLIFEVYFYLVFSTFIGKNRRLVLAFLIAWVLLLLAINSTGFESGNPYLGFLINPYPLEFAFGILTASIFNYLRLKFSIWMCITSILVSIVSLSWLYEVIYGQLLLQTLAFGFFYSVILYSFVSIEQTLSISSGNWLVKLGDMSYSVYLSNLIVLSALAKIFSLFDIFKMTFWGHIVFVVLGLVLVFSISHLSWKLVEVNSYRLIVNRIIKK